MNSKIIFRIKIAFIVIIVLFTDLRLESVVNNFDTHEIKPKEENVFSRYLTCSRNLAEFYLKKRKFTWFSTLSENSLLVSEKTHIIWVLPTTHSPILLFNFITNYSSFFLLYNIGQVKTQTSTPLYTNLYNDIKESIKYQGQRQQTKIETFNVEKSTSELEVASQKHQNYHFTYAFIVVFFIAVVFFYLLKIKEERNREFFYRNMEIEKNNTTLVKKNIELQKQLGEREVLIKEIHHRTKNNLQLILSMLNLKNDFHRDSNVRRFVERSTTQINSMAMVHQLLYSTDAIDQIDFDLYLKKLIGSIYQSFYDNMQSIAHTENAENCFFDMKTTISLGIIINELVFNAFKHAFPNNRSGKLSVEASIDELNNITIKVSDNGIGIPEQTIEKESYSHGLRIVKLLVRQLNGKIKINSDNGTSIVIIFNKKPLHNEPKKSTYS